MKQIIISLLFLSGTISCKKSTTEYSPATFCWVITNPQLVTIKTVCDKTFDDMPKEYPDGWYYRQDEILYCWYEASTARFIQNCPPSLLNKIAPGGSFSTVSCSYCARWYHREKKKYIPTGGITYSPVTFERFCGDTLQTLYRGR